MKDNYFLINGKTYVISYKDFKLDIFRLENNQRVELSGIEREYMDNIISRNSSYIYTSVKLEEIVSNNPSISNNPIAPNFIEWIESFIPVDARDNFYKNVETLKIEEMKEVEKGITAYYNAKENTICLLPIDSYASELEYTKNLFHELLHMASSRYDKETGEVLSGLDKAESDFSESNRGLTEGITEVIAFNGLSQSIGKSTEGLIVEQLSRLVDPNVIIESYFANKGITDIKSGLDTIGNDSNRSEELLRDIEINYCFSDEADAQNALGNIQDNLIDFFKMKVDKGLIDNTIDIEALPAIFESYEECLITPTKLVLLGKEPDCFDGIKESIVKFDEYKRRYMALAAPTSDYEVGHSISRAGFSTVVLLSLITFIIAVGIIVLGVYLGM